MHQRFPLIMPLVDYFWPKDDCMDYVATVFNQFFAILQVNLLALISFTSFSLYSHLLKNGLTCDLTQFDHKKCF